MPGNNGGGNYGGAAIDPANGDLYVVSKDLPAMLKLELASQVSHTGSPAEQGRSVFARTAAYVTAPIEKANRRRSLLW